MRTTGILLTAGFLWAGTGAFAAGPDTTLGAMTAHLEVRADLAGATAMIDSIRTGPVPFLCSLDPGTYIVRVLPPDPADWHVRAVAETLSLAPGENRTLSVALRTHISIMSTPPGAGIYVNDSLTGMTPLLLPSSAIPRGAAIAVRKQGFEPAMIREAPPGETVLQIVLKQGWQTEPDDASPFVSPTEGWNGRRIAAYASGGVAILAGVGAAWFKIAADEQQALFQETGEQRYLSERRRLDTRAGIALAVAQIGLGVLTYILITE